MNPQMADELDRRFMPEFLQTTLAISLGAAFRSLEMLRHPSDTVSKMISEMKEVVTLPDDTGSGIQEKVQALAGNCLEKSAAFVNDLKTTGERFSEGTEGA